MSFKLSVLITLFFALSVLAAPAPAPQRGGGGHSGPGGAFGGGGGRGGGGPIRGGPPAPVNPGRPISSGPVPIPSATVPVAAPSPSAPAGGGGAEGACSLSAKMIPSSGLGAPTQALKSVVVGVGIQNYTCSDAGIYASAGAVAQLFDISCLEGGEFDDIQDEAITNWSLSSGNARTITAGAIGLAGTLTTQGSHFFVTSPSGTGISPVWDYRNNAARGNADGFVLAAKVANVPAPTGSKDVDWLQLKNVQGGLATEIYRTDTRAGQPPASCTPGSEPISVKYTSKYWLFGGTVL